MIIVIIVIIGVLMMLLLFLVLNLLDLLMEFWEVEQWWFIVGVGVVGGVGHVSFVSFVLICCLSKVRQWVVLVTAGKCALLVVFVLFFWPVAGTGFRTG